ncbi:MAG: class I adenylate-forming enzyme family protein, partial [Desulfomonilaceae bacterium]
ETVKALVDGWFLTGDLARCDPSGLITITGRIKELIIRGGENIAPAEIEEVVMQIPEIEDCCAVAGPDKNLGEIPVLFVVPKPGVQFDRGTVMDICAKHLSSYKVPAAIHFIDRIPRTGSGKALRHQLTRLLE